MPGAHTVPVDGGESSAPSPLAAQAGPAGSWPTEPAARPGVAGWSRRRRSVTAGMVLAALVVLLGVAGLGWRITGGHWEIVATPSMGHTAPVGSLVFSRPVHADGLAVGDIVSYHPPGTRGETITHRVVRVDSQGGIHTRGDINPADDPWTLHTGDLLGRVTSIWWGLGWLVRALPLLVIGSLVLWWATKMWAAQRWRIPARIMGFSLLLSMAAFLLQPFVGMVLLGSTADQDGTHATLVSTGLLPIRISAATGGQVDLGDGHVGVLSTHIPVHTPGVRLTSHPHLSWWQWIVFIAICCIPLFYALAAGNHPRDDPPGKTEDDAARGDDPDETGSDKRDGQAQDPTAAAAQVQPPTDPGLYTHHPVRRGQDRWITVALVAGALTLTGGAGASTSAAFVATITNTSNTAGAAASFFTCASAVSALGAANTIFTYPLSDSPVTSGRPAADVSGNTRNGGYSNNFTTATSRPCPRDATSTAVTAAPTAALPSFIYPASGTLFTSLNVFTEAIWFKTSTTTGGRLIGWGNSYNGTSSTYDRHIFLNNAGNVVFGVQPNTVKVIATPKTYNDGAWHQAVATLSTAGMALYLDGTLVASDTTVTTAKGGTGNTGYWRVGHDNVNGWGSNTPTTNYYTGGLAWASVFTTALTATQIKNLYNAGT